MTPNPVTVTPDETVYEAAVKMAELGVGALPVIDEEGRLVGIFTERDLLVRVVAKGLDPTKIRVGEVMTPNPVTVGPDEPVEEALRLMAKIRARHLPVVDEKGRLVGIVSIRDLELVLL
ncbi:MAG: CBS domain-containing protein [Desulfurococcales archaeon]|nr:CBS domain-containing protein [Desulfurococcales archaeon]